MTISKDFQTLQNGLHIYTAGVALQQFFIICFLCFVFHFNRRIKRECPDRIAEAHRLLWVMYFALTMISVSSNFAPLLNLANHPTDPYYVPYYRVLVWSRHPYDTPSAPTSGSNSSLMPRQCSLPWLA